MTYQVVAIMKELNNMKIYRFSAILLLLINFSCVKENQNKTNWSYQTEIQLDNINPIGITSFQNNLWISDSDHNRVIAINKQGEILKTIDSLDRPMHIDASSSSIYVPQYGNDIIAVINNNKILNLSTKDSLDAPAGISIFNNEKAIADFYNHRILFFNGNNWISFGKEGKLNGEFYYPTDVQITDNKIYVADAYNNRVQVFDKKGKFLQKIGEEQNLNAATGIYVSKESIFVTDFENNRVLVFDFTGKLKQEIIDNIEKPTDLYIFKEQLYILNYRKKTINIYKK